MSRAQQYSVTQQPEVPDDKKDPYIATLSQADLKPRSSNRGTSSTSCTGQMCELLATFLCCLCICRMCESTSDGCGECDCTGCDC